MRTIFFGTNSVLSARVLRALLDANVDLIAVVAGASPIRVAGRAGAATGWRTLEPNSPAAGMVIRTRPADDSIVHAAWDRDVPVFEVSDARSPVVRGRLEALYPDLFCVACFPFILPGRTLALATAGGLNVHPSLLPAHRGPAPLFWTFRRGDRCAGATVHVLDRRVDAGPIVAQRSFELPDGASGPEIASRCAELGASLLLEVVRHVGTGDLVHRHQDESAASLAPWPRPEDYRIPTDRPARWAFNFARGVAAWRGPLAVETGEARIPVAEALEFAPTGDLSAGGAGERVFRFSPGWVRFRLR